jgi:gamma-glutamylcyclotransferase (GGCT)/AIG2-like uncharacterized protein YtfP
MDDAAIRLFAYGTLQQFDVQQTLFGRRLEGQPDVLPGFALSSVTITDPAVLAASGAAVHPIVAPSADPQAAAPGTVFEITAQELAAADAYEADDYRRIPVILASGLEAFVYVAAPGLDLDAPADAGEEDENGLIA